MGAIAAGGLALTRLNHDSSWLVELDGTTILLDPWLEGPAVVVVPPVHRARLGRPTWPVSALPEVDALVVSHPFADHCNPTTLRRLPKDLPVYAPPIAAALTRRHGGFTDVHVLPDTTKGAAPEVVGAVRVAWCRAPRLGDTTHNALVLQGTVSGATVVYAPHAFATDSPVAAAVDGLLGGRRLDALLVSFTFLDLPWYLGGVANLGPDAALGLAERWRPRFVVPTHDGAKVDEGFIARVQALVPYPGVAEGLAARGVDAATFGDTVGERLRVA